MVNQKLFSIIIATYNCGQKIEYTLQSILSQNRELFELIVLDGASTDDTLEYLQKYEQDLTLISKKDDGLYHAFNRGIELATGKYLYFIGAGDCLKSGILDRIKELLPSETPSVVYGQCYYVKQSKNYGKGFRKEFFFHDNLCQQGIFYHSEVFNIIGKFDLKYKVYADWFLNINCFTNNKIETQYIDYVIAAYEEGGMSENSENDPAFKKDFPVFIRRKFGVYKYLLSKMFFLEPYIFNCIYFSYYERIPYYLIYYYLPGYLGAI